MKQYEARRGLRYGKKRWAGYIDGEPIAFMGLMIGDYIPCIHRYRWAALFHAWFTFKTQGNRHTPEWVEERR